MKRVILKVDGMSCGHCVKAVTQAAGKLPGVKSVSVDLAAKTVAVEYNPERITLEKIEYEIEDQGYDVIHDA